MKTHSEFRNRIRKLVFTSAWILLVRPITWLTRVLYRLGMKVEFLKDWGSSPHPEWFDHELDLALFHEWRRPHFFERGVYASEIVEGKCVLDLCCGDGSVSALFISPLAKSVLAVDFDPKAIAYADSHWGHLPQLEFRLNDIRRLQVPPGSFEACIWEAAIEHFTEAEMKLIISSIKAALTSDGVLHGHTIKKQDHVSHHDHEYEFSSAKELHDFLAARFKHVSTWERVHGDRTNFYFRCADQMLPVNRQ